MVAHYRRHGRAIFLHHLAFTALTFSGYGVGSWLPSFFVRSFGWSIGQSGFWLGLNAAVTASVSVIIGGTLADRWYRQGKKDAKMRVPLLGSLLWLVPGFGYLLAPSGTLSMVLLMVATLVGTLGIGCIVASLQELMPNRMRGQAVAIYAVVANLIGIGPGPTAVALLTDYVFGDESMLRYSLLIVAVVCHRHHHGALALAPAFPRERDRDRARGGGGCAAACCLLRGGAPSQRIFGFDCSDRGAAAPPGYFDYTGRDDVLAGGVKRIPIETSKGTFQVWTKRDRKQPQDQSPAPARRTRRHPRVLRGLRQLLPQRLGIEYYYVTDQLGLLSTADQPDAPELWEVPRFARRSSSRCAAR